MLKNNIFLADQANNELEFSSRAIFMIRQSIPLKQKRRGLLRYLLANGREYFVMFFPKALQAELYQKHDLIFTS